MDSILRVFVCVFLVFLWDYGVACMLSIGCHDRNAHVYTCTRAQGSDLDPHAHTYASLTLQMGETLVMTFNPTLPSLSTHPES